jgi:hypothetical protein
LTTYAKYSKPFPLDGVIVLKNPTSKKKSRCRKLRPYGKNVLGELKTHKP